MAEADGTSLSQVVANIGKAADKDRIEHHDESA